MTQDDAKRLAAEAALEPVTDGMVLGLGTGSTAAFMVEALGRRVKSGLRILGIPTSERTAAQAASLGIPLTDIGSHPVIDLTIDGADEVDTTTLDLIKGLGGALLREKLVAAASRRMTVIVDGSKLVPRLGATVRLPVEVVAFAWQSTAARLEQAGANPILRGGPATPYVTDGGNHIMDCAFGPIPDAPALAAHLKSITGVVDTGLFVRLATSVIAGTEQGILRLEPPKDPK